MKFRPCIDIHNGKVKQIVGGSLRDQGDQAKENFAADQGADYFAEMYKKDGLKGGHVILLNPASSEYYGQTKKQALKALHAYPGGLQIGGGITADNASEYIRAGASHVIVTSYVFKNGEIYWDNLKKLCMAVGKEHVVLDLSCRKKDGRYYIVTDIYQCGAWNGDPWQTVRLLRRISGTWCGCGRESFWNRTGADRDPEAGRHSGDLCRRYRKYGGSGTDTQNRKRKG